MPQKRVILSGTTPTFLCAYLQSGNLLIDIIVANKKTEDTEQLTNEYRAGPRERCNL